MVTAMERSSKVAKKAVCKSSLADNNTAIAGVWDALS